jgi:hypothetical protein
MPEKKAKRQRSKNFSITGTDLEHYYETDPDTPRRSNN